MARPPTHSSWFSTVTGSELDSPMKPKTNGVPGREMQILLLAYAPIIAGVVWVNIRLGHE